ncbi:outer membrane protein assembly factor BamA [Ectothiorhodospira variabilis]|uniref:outer membrane protein assembly factor BamA n=1 Tax=Ectothiorhodospira variabilis TaxID=505694 RepID=UPI001EFA2C9D|nr:outer membrane protein assembly factor BamA [Ectothiorhodospira variabilis]MCG5493901.1 outer membrane protein assembly factor BamA [Ectothiorhodospira variabilis]MCG5498115.1 outer membrane protein assembly factor BamA [Ectothiorhodospira variabilis]MCG5503704.1 outer membrane protein assembly factor BamA [Ectothiorhodospira variabilis]MCG5506860.1 outer membrane protein assembly factor BamA [Ectothiorhodospira variabilis]
MFLEVRRLIAGTGLAIALASTPTILHASNERFVIEDIEVEGLQRIAAGTVFSYLPVGVGDSFDEAQSAEVIRALYRTGFFSDVSLLRRDGVLVVMVEERPAINEIRISGNRDIKTDQLMDALQQVGMARGRVFNRSVLERMENELLQQYFARGKYNVQVDVEVDELPRNRVDVVIDIAEGRVARIQQINLVGNETYTDRELTRRFDSGAPPWYNPFSRRDHYSRQRLSGDLEELRSRYLDSGFVNFNIDSTQVTLTPDRKDIYVTINIDEGDQYSISEVSLAGDLVVSEEELRELLDIQPGDTFSRSRITRSANAISDRLGDEGHAFANVNPIPELDEENQTVALTFFVDPGQRVYVRRINFSGNTRTRDEVFRREMRQMEGGWYSASNVDRSQVRLQRLSYVENVNVETRRVPGTEDQVDLDITVRERLSGNFMVGAGYSQSQGVLFNTSLSQENFFGTGNRVSLAVNTSRVSTLYSLSYTNPYYTIDGVSRGFNIFYRETDAFRADISRYSSNRFGANITYGIPLTEYNTFRITPGFESVEILTSDNTPDEIFDYLETEGDRFDLYTLTTSLSHDTRNRTVFAEKGNLQRGTLEFSLPGSDLEYYKIDYRNQLFVPVRDNLTFKLSGEVAYGESYGDTSDLPFFEKYFAGGTRSVRGYRDLSLGPRDSRDDPFGGNFRVLGGAELIFPPPFMEEAPNVRMSLFLDAGQVYPSYDDFKADEIRASVGVGMTWLSPVGALTFSLAEALNDEPGDRLQSFQFNIGASF